MERITRDRLLKSISLFIEWMCVRQRGDKNKECTQFQNNLFPLLSIPYFQLPLNTEQHNNSIRCIKRKQLFKAIQVKKPKTKGNSQLILNLNY